MGLGSEDGKVETACNTCQSKGRRKKKDSGSGGDEVVERSETGCWVKFRFIGSCISSRSKVDSSVSGTSTHCGNSYS